MNIGEWIINEFVTTPDLPNLKMASILDIAIMKIVVIGGRCAKKDFFDLYIIGKCNFFVKIYIVLDFMYKISV